MLHHLSCREFLVMIQRNYRRSPKYRMSGKLHNNTFFRRPAHCLRNFWSFILLFRLFVAIRARGCERVFIYLIMSVSGPQSLLRVSLSVDSKVK